MQEEIIIKPQEGPQEDFLSSEADIVFYGGAAGGGKSFGLILDPLRYIDDSTFNGAFFRRTFPEIIGGGGLWETASQVYPFIGGEPNEAKMRYNFPSGAFLGMSHMQHVKDMYKHQGKQYTWIGIDEVTHFKERQFWYLFTRNRSGGGCKIKPCIRATCNPDPDSWVKKLIQWWIGDDGFPIYERSGVIRYFIRKEEEIEWVDKDYVDDQGHEPISITFIPSKLEDNKILTKNDPSYRRKLMALDPVTKAQLLGGNWNIKNTKGTVIDGYTQDNKVDGYAEYVKDNYRYIFGGYDRGYTHRAGIVVIGVTMDWKIETLKAVGYSGLNFMSLDETETTICSLIKELNDEFDTDFFFCSHEANEHIVALNKLGIKARSWLEGYSGDNKIQEAKENEKTKTKASFDYLNMLYRENIKTIKHDQKELISDIGNFKYKELPDGTYNMNEYVKEFDDVLDADRFACCGYPTLRRQMYEMIQEKYSKGVDEANK